MPAEEARDYEKVKQIIMSTLNISEEIYRARLRAATYSKDKGLRWLANIIRTNGMKWLKPAERSTEEVVEMICLEQFLTALPPAARSWVRCKEPEMLEEAVIMESY